MDVIDLGKPKVFKFAWNGETFEIGYPKMKDLKDLPSGEELSGKESIDFSINFLVGLGMSREVLEDMDYDVVIKIQEQVTAHSSKKK